MTPLAVIVNALAAHRFNPLVSRPHRTKTDRLHRCSCGTLCVFESTWREHVAEVILNG